ncbi:MAG: hypothetical protein JWO05_1249 [Gemmatimonadetes bacterium]|nr:hypothetical protein [Gemmatimonadota bacterium]
MKRAWLATVTLLMSCHNTPPHSWALSSSAGSTDLDARHPLPTGGSYAPADARPVFPAGWYYPAGARAEFAAHAMVASEAPLATDAGLEVMRAGGNAVDAAVAVGFALAVVYPQAGNIGGGGYMVIHLADGRDATIDYREVAPAASSRDMFLDAAGKLTDDRLVGPRASGVPGAVAGLVAAQAKYGALKLADVMAPAIRYAREGIAVDADLASSLSSHREYLSQGRATEVFFRDGAPLQQGARLRQEALARTLSAIARDGADGFYRGEVAGHIASELHALGGLVTEQDLAGYAPVWREPLRNSFRGYRVIGMPPSSSGGITVAETMNILAGYPTLAAWGTPEYAHILSAAFQRAFIDRNSKLADPAFAPVPVALLISREHADRWRATIEPNRATPTPALAGMLREGMETTHYSVVDAMGNAVATTTTLNELYGSAVYLARSGFFLNDELDDFAAAPGQANMFGLVQGEANAIAPGKRPLSAMSPTIVLDADGKVFMVAGARGGPRIITGTTQVLLNVLEHHMTLADAVSAPRIHHQALPDVIGFEQRGLDAASLQALTGFGYTVKERTNVGVVEAILRVRGGWQGVADPRAGGKASGY